MQFGSSAASIIVPIISFPIATASGTNAVMLFCISACLCVSAVLLRLPKSEYVEPQDKSVPVKESKEILKHLKSEKGNHT